MDPASSRFRERLQTCERQLAAFEAWSSKRRTLFWTLHSLWALATGVVVVILAHERYTFVPWIFGMLALTWVSTLFFSRRGSGVPASPIARLGGGFVSYLTRVMYQETLFFLLPFYAYSTSIWPEPAWNVLFLILLATLAILSCLDLVFDRILREQPLFALLFFSSVAFAGLNFLLPVMFQVRLDRATQLAAWIAVASALPLSFGGRSLQMRQASVGALIAAGFAFGVSSLAWVVVPPVPLRLQQLTFARDIERDPLRVRGSLQTAVDADELPSGRIGAVARIFSPTRLPAEVVLTWDRDGERIRDSRRVEIETHRGGFRVWDVLTFKNGIVPPGRYGLTVFVDGRLLGRREIFVVAGSVEALDSEDPEQGQHREHDDDDSDQIEDVGWHLQSPPSSG